MFTNKKISPRTSNGFSSKKRKAFCFLFHCNDIVARRGKACGITSRDQRARWRRACVWTSSSTCWSPRVRQSKVASKEQERCTLGYREVTSQKFWGKEEKAVEGGDSLAQCKGLLSRQKAPGVVCLWKLGDLHLPPNTFPFSCLWI